MSRLSLVATARPRADGTLALPSHNPAVMPDGPRNPNANGEHIRFVLDGLPSTLAGMTPGLLYGLACDHQTVRLALGLQSLSKSANRRAPSVLLTDQDPATLLRKSATIAPALQDQVSDGSARILAMQANISEYLLRYGVSKLIGDVQKHGIAANSLIVIDQAETVLCLADPRLVVAASSLFRVWAKQAQVAILFLIHQDESQPRQRASLQAVAKDWGGLALIDTAHAPATVVFEQWFAPGGVPLSRHFALETSADGWLCAKSISRTVTGGVLTRPTANSTSILAISRAISGLQLPNYNVIVCDSELQIIQNIRSTACGLILFAYSRFAAYERLAKLVAFVRATASHDPLIVVRECGVPLRQSERLSLKSVGVSLIIPYAQSDHDAQLLLEQILLADLVGQRPSTNENAAPPAIFRVDQRLPLPSFTFRESVDDALDGSDISVPHTLIRIATHEPRLASRLVNRAVTHVRDMRVTVINDNVFLFLYGCGGNASEMVVSRILGRGDESVPLWSQTSNAAVIRRQLATI